MGGWNSGRRAKEGTLKVVGGRVRAKSVPQLPPATADFDTPPQELQQNKRAMAEWARVVPLLRQSGLVTTADRSALIACCQQWSRYLDTEQKIRASGQGDSATLARFIRISDKALHQCVTLWRDLGLTPKGRARLSKLPLAETPEQSKWAGLL